MRNIAAIQAKTIVILIGFVNGELPLTQLPLRFEEAVLMVNIALWKTAILAKNRSERKLRPETSSGS